VTKKIVSEGAARVWKHVRKKSEEPARGASEQRNAFGREQVLLMRRSGDCGPTRLDCRYRPTQPKTFCQEELQSLASSFNQRRLVGHRSRVRKVAVFSATASDFSFHSVRSNGDSPPCHKQKPRLARPATRNRFRAALKEQFGYIKFTSNNLAFAEASPLQWGSALRC